MRSSIQKKLNQIQTPNWLTQKNTIIFTAIVIILLFIGAYIEASLFRWPASIDEIGRSILSNNLTLEQDEFISDDTIWCKYIVTDSNIVNNYLEKRINFNTYGEAPSIINCSSRKEKESKPLKDIVISKEIFFNFSHLIVDILFSDRLQSVTNPVRVEFNYSSDVQMPFWPFQNFKKYLRELYDISEKSENGRSNHIIKLSVKKVQIPEDSLKSR